MDEEVSATMQEQVQSVGADEEIACRLRQLEESLKANPDNASLHYDIGLVLWEKAGGAVEIKEKAAGHFLISAKLNPQNGYAFKFLGHYYLYFSGDTQRALKCYQRAVAVNPEDSDSGDALCDLLDESGKETLEMAICREASDKSPRAFWAFRRLGFLQTHYKKWSEAVQSLQHAIRGYPTSAHLWEALGLSYQQLGRFTAALKSYGRAIELEKTLVFSLIESGNIHLILRSFQKGVEQFRQALDLLPHCISAYYGLASGLLGVANECISTGAFKWGTSLLEEATEIARKSIAVVANVSCIWKLFGDIQLTYAKCFPWVEECWGLTSDEQAYKASVLSWKRACTLAAMSARCSYQHALHLAPWQANIYTDIAIASDLVASLEESDRHELNSWQLPEKMSLGALMLESDSFDFWVSLGCLSNHNALKQHALIRGLQLDVSLAIAWAFLGKLYQKEDEVQLARQAFDCSRSIDPSLALPWASMAATFHAREPERNVAFENCLRAVQILPLAEFQIGLAKLALLSENLSSPQVFGAIQQAVQRAPHYPESHNLHGLVCEAREDYQSAAVAYRLARLAVNTSSGSASKLLLRDISINLARALTKGGLHVDALLEYANMQKEGMLDGKGLQMYGLSLWQLGKTDLAISVVKNLANNVSDLDQASVPESISFIVRLLYQISGSDAAIKNILKMPKELFQSSKVSFVISAIHALDVDNQLKSVVSSSRCFLRSHQDITKMHMLIALEKLVKNQSQHSLGFQSGIDHLRKALHMFPNNSLIRNLLGYLLLFVREWKSSHLAGRCCVLDIANHHDQQGLTSASDILGAGAVACYSIGNNNPKFSFPTCLNHHLNGPVALRHLQKCLHQNPWNHNARYLLVLNYLQKAREERYPHHLCVSLERLILQALSDEFSSQSDVFYRYRKFQLLLCASETSLQLRKQINCISLAKRASEILLPGSCTFFAHLLLCRVYAMNGDVLNFQEEYVRCLKLKTDVHIGWICLKLVTDQTKMQTNSDIIDLSFHECLNQGEASSLNMWTVIFHLVKAFISISNQDYLSAQEFLASACSLDGAESCLYLLHGSTCMELGRQFVGPEFPSLALKSLVKAEKNSLVPLPLVSILRAQAEGSLGSKVNWLNNLRREWFTWPPEMRPAELFFQMHLLARHLKAESEIPSSYVEACQSPQVWVLRAIHTNPSCMRYWKVLQKLVD